jgi:hypothetical protein
MFKFTVAILCMAQLVSAASPEQPLAGQTDFQANSTIPFFVPGRYLRVYVLRVLYCTSTGCHSHQF